MNIQPGRVLLAISLLLASVVAFAHGVADRDALFLEQNPGMALVAFAYLGAKHMITGYDHLLYLAGVIFFLYHTRDIALYVTLFAVGHSVTLLAGVLADIHVNVYIVDAIIGLSVVYKAFENLGGFEKFFGWQPNPGPNESRADVAVRGRPSVVVAPFEDLSGGPDHFFANGLAQEVLSKIVRFDALVVFDGLASFRPL